MTTLLILHLYSISVPQTATDYLKQMETIRSRCEELGQGCVPLFHYTSVGVSDYILGWGFRMSTQGQGDGGVYFSALSPASYHMGSVTYEDNLITDCFGRGRLTECKYSHSCFSFFV